MVKQIELETFNYSLQDNLWYLFKKEFSIIENYDYMNYTNEIIMTNEKYYGDEKVFNDKWIYDKYNNPLSLKEIFKGFLRLCKTQKNYKTDIITIINFNNCVDKIIKFFNTDIADTYILIGLFLEKEIENIDSYIYKAKIID